MEVLLQMSQMFFGFLRERLFWAHVGHPATFVSPWFFRLAEWRLKIAEKCVFFPGVDHGWPEKDKRNCCRNCFEDIPTVAVPPRAVFFASQLCKLYDMFCACLCMFDKKLQTSLCFLHGARKPLFNTLVALTPNNIVNTSVVWCFCLLRFKILQAHTTWPWKEQRLENLWSQCGRLLPFTLMQVDRLSREQQRLKALLLRSGATTDVSEYLSTRFSWAGKSQQRCVFGKNQTGPCPGSVSEKYGRLI